MSAHSDTENHTNHNRSCDNIIHTQYSPMAQRIAFLNDALRRLSDPPVVSTGILAGNGRSSSSSGSTNESSTTANNLFSESTTMPSLDEITERYAPVMMESQFRDLYSAVRPALVVTIPNRTTTTTTTPPPSLTLNPTRRRNTAAFVQGPRGSGKSLLVNTVLTALADEIRANASSQGKYTCGNTPVSCMFRLVYVNGILIPGQNVHLVVREMLPQLSMHERVETKENNYMTALDKGRTNPLQCLTDIVKIARMDGIPVLFVLDELDTFVPECSGYHNPTNKRKYNNSGSTSIKENSTSFSQSNSIVPQSQNRQVLLYHLLERVATQSSFCSVIGLTSDLAFFGRLEKRIKSRVEGTARYFFTKPLSSFEDLTRVLLSSINHSYRNKRQTNQTTHIDAKDTVVNEKKINTNNKMSHVELLQQEVSLLFRKSKNNESERTSPAHEIYVALDHEYRRGRDLRWFRRVLYHSLALYKFDLLQQQQQQRPPPPLPTTNDNTATSKASPLILFHSGYVNEAFKDMGGLMLNTDTGVSNKSMESNLRLQTLRDMSGPHVALVLSAQRILYRDTKKVAEDTADGIHQALTLSRILNEYRTSYKSSRYKESILRRAFADLMDMGLFRPNADHMGEGPFQYRFSDDVLYSYTNMDSVDRLPLRLMVDIYRELKQAIDENIFNCSTALIEWGRHAK